MISNILRLQGRDPYEFFSGPDPKPPLIGIGETETEWSPCNGHLRDLAKIVEEELWQRGMIGIIDSVGGFNDAHTMATPGMRYSLPSRQITSDGFEKMAIGFNTDGWIALVDCDKTVPSPVISAGSITDRPCVVVYGGTIKPGHFEGREIDIGDSVESAGNFAAGRIDEQQMMGIQVEACPGFGGCGMSATSFSSAVVNAALGMQIISSASTPAEDPYKQEECRLAAQYLERLMREEIYPQQIVSREAILNGAKALMLCGGSTNCVMHLLAIAQAFEIDFSYHDFQEVALECPVILNMRPLGKYSAIHLHHRAGGLPALFKYAIAEGLLNGDCLTITGESLRASVAEAADLKFGSGEQDVVLPVANPLYQSGHLRFLTRGNLVEGGGAVVKFKTDNHTFDGTARVYENEDAAAAGFAAGEFRAGDVIVVLGEGPAGGPGMRELLRLTALMYTSEISDEIVLVTVGRLSGVSRARALVVHLSPEEFHGGLIGLVKTGDSIRIDGSDGTIDLIVDEAEIEARRSAWERPAPLPGNGRLARFQRHVQPADKGCIEI